MPWHAHSLFTEAPLRPFTIGDRALWLARLDAACRARLITPAFQLIGRALLKRLGPDGRLDPSQETLAADTGRSERTVRRAIRALADACLLTWQRRLVRDGWAVRQTSNGYTLTPSGPPLPLPPPLRTKGIGSTAKLSAGGNPPRSVAQQIAALAEWAASGLPAARQTVCP
jgi:AraC-like DNA-binding protein